MVDFAGKRQQGAVPVLVIGAIVVAIIILLLILMNRGGDEEAQTQTSAPQEQIDIKPVDLASSKPIEKVGGTDDGRTDSEKLDRLYKEGQTKRPFEDGYESEDVGRDVANPTITAFDFGVLDGRVRVGIFGNGSIPKFSTKQSGNDYVIEIPGEYKFRRPLEKRLTIDSYRVNTARLEHNASGMKLRISVSQPLEHEPFLIEDTYGLMMAFEPRKK